jgi:hypothetical protein
VLAKGDGDALVYFLDVGVGVVVVGFFELLLAEFEPGFLDGNTAFAGGGVAVAAEHGGDFSQGVHVFVHGGTGEGELEGELFEDADGADGEVGLTVGGELEDLAGGFLAVEVVLIEELGGGGALDEALESRFVDGDVEFLRGAFGSLAVAEVFDEGAELLELGSVEGFEAFNVGLHTLFRISDFGFRISDFGFRISD